MSAQRWSSQVVKFQFFLISFCHVRVKSRGRERSERTKQMVLMPSLFCVYLSHNCAWRVNERCQLEKLIKIFSNKFSWFFLLFLFFSFEITQRNYDNALVLFNIFFTKCCNCINNRLIHQQTTATSASTWSIISSRLASAHLIRIVRHRSCMAISSGSSVKNTVFAELNHQVMLDAKRRSWM